MPLPPRIKNAPQVDERLTLFWVAFHELGSTRSFGFSVGPIPWTAIKQWADEYDLDADLREDLFYYIAVLDEEYLKHHAQSDKT